MGVAVVRTELESRYFCSSLVFQNLSWAHTGSCVTDLHSHLEFGMQI